MNFDKVKKYNVLYVEDEISVQQTTLTFFNKFFKNVDVANNGQEGFDKFKSAEYDLVITDMKMPIMSGAQMLKKIKKINPKITTMMCTAADSYKKLPEKECDISMKKPVYFDEFIKILEQLEEIIENKKHTN